MTQRGRHWLPAFTVLLMTAARGDSPDVDALVRQRVDYDADTPKTIFELQPFRTQSQVRVTRVNGLAVQARLTDLNPSIALWYVLTFWTPGSETSYALELAHRPRPLTLVTRKPGIVSIAGQGFLCDLGAGEPGRSLDLAARSGLPYVSLCGGELYLRNPVVGHRTSLESITDFLRDNVWGGDRLIGFVKKELYRDAFLEEGGRGAGEPQQALAIGPSPAIVSADATAPVVPERLGLALEAPTRELTPGGWYRLRGVPDVFVSAIAPANIDSRVLTGHERSVNPLDSVERGALVYLIAFDLAALDLHFVLGTDHPRLDWSDRPPPGSQDSRLPGPDGIGSAAPLIRNGMIKPSDVETTVAAFAGGFKRSHGAFRHGVLAERNHGSHYGFVEEGVIFSKLQPGLATVVVEQDGHADLRTWQDADNALLSRIRYARQNGVPLIEYDTSRQRGVPGDLVNLWGPGNWSGSANEDLRTLRAGLCLQESSRGRFLIYGYFSAATPSAMARVFQAYGCRYAMHLDMNALEHTYLAAYVHRDGARVVEHLVTGMEEVDRAAGSQFVPRFLGFPDDRDFFYLTRKATR